MKMFFKLAWRNIFRNKRRTIIAGIAIGIGLASMIFVDALIIGMERNMISSATESFLGEGQIHADGYRETHEPEMTIHNLDSTLKALRSDTLINNATPRIMSFAMISSPANVSAVSMVGINPETEKDLSQIDEALIEGDYIQSDNLQNILIGRELADLLEIGMGDRVVVTASEPETGSLSQEMFRVSGVFYFNVEGMDKGMVFINIDKAREMLNLKDQAHEIAFDFTEAGIGRDSKHPFWNQYSKGKNEAVGWAVLMPQLKAALEMSQFSTYIVGIVLFSVVALGIINTLFMSLHERMFEFGVMRAVGTGPFAIGRLIIFEAGALALISIVFGNILGFLVTLILAQTGIDYSGIEFAGVTFRHLLYPVMKLYQYIEFPILVFLFTLIIGLYPAIYAARMKPSNALRKLL